MNEVMECQLKNKLGVVITIRIGLVILEYGETDARQHWILKKLTESQITRGRSHMSRPCEQGVSWLMLIKKYWLRPSFALS